MSLKNKLLGINNPKQKPKPKIEWHLKPEHQVSLAFTTADGTEYFHFTTGYNTYVDRYMAGMDRINEIEQRVDKQYLDTFQKLLREYINKGDIRMISILEQNLTDRRTYVFNQELLYNLASVWFFDKNENCYTYDYEYADQKISKWKKEKDLLAFFLQTELVNYMPPLNISMEQLPNYIAGYSIKNLQILKYHLSQLSKKSSDSELISTLQSQIEELEELIMINSSEKQ